jgi:hypothetical protein
VSLPRASLDCNSCRMLTSKLVLALDRSGVQYRSELIFADDGGTVMGSTSAAPYQDKLLLTGEFQATRPCLRSTRSSLFGSSTGLYSEEVVICTIPTRAK